MNFKIKLTTLVICIVTSIFARAFAEGSPHERLYTLSNETSENAVLAFKRSKNGNWGPAGRFPTGGFGTGGGLGNQGALALSENGRFLFAANAGSDDVSVFRVSEKGLELLDYAAVAGEEPVSVTVDHNLVYVVNAVDDSIFGFRFDPHDGKLHPLPGSHFSLSTNGTSPAQISFNPAGDALVVTEKATNTITTFTLDDGLPQQQFTITSAGNTPFGFAFGKRDQFFVSEANGLVNGAGATVSSYEIIEDGSVRLIDGATAVNQAAACWLVTTPNGRIAFTANTPALTISSFKIDPAGNITLLETIAADNVANPRDMAMTSDGKTLFTLNGGDNTIGVYKVSASGKLRKRQIIDNLPTGFTGLVVR
ncbi:MAG: lactonase family protein [Gammaproteobacteria bacterium]